LNKGFSLKAVPPPAKLSAPSRDWWLQQQAEKMRFCLEATADGKT
jgi:hypothetical protein